MGRADQVLLRSSATLRTLQTLLGVMQVCCRLGLPLVLPQGAVCGLGWMV